MNATANAAVRWWRSQFAPGDDRPRDPAAVAKLRRCRRPDDAFLLPEFHEVRRAAGIEDEREAATLALLLGVLAHVRKDTSTPFPVQLGTPRADRPAMSPLRFQRFLQIQDDGDLQTMAIRAVRLLDHEANVAHLAQSLAEWGEPTKRRWSMDYYTTVPDPRHSK